MKLTVCGGCVYSEAEVSRYKMMSNYPARIYTLALIIPVSLVIMHQNTKVIAVPKGLAVQNNNNKTQNLQTFISDSNPSSKEVKKGREKRLTATNFPPLRMMTPLQY